MGGPHAGSPLCIRACRRKKSLRKEEIYEVEEEEKREEEEHKKKRKEEACLNYYILNFQIFVLPVNLQHLLHVLWYMYSSTFLRHRFFFNGKYLTSKQKIQMMKYHWDTWDITRYHLSKKCLCRRSVPHPFAAIDAVSNYQLWKSALSLYNYREPTSFIEVAQPISLLFLRNSWLLFPTLSYFLKNFLQQIDVFF